MLSHPQPVVAEPDSGPATGSIANLDISRLIQEKLRDNRYTAIRDVQCEDLGAMLRLHGRVQSQYMKQVAFAVACEFSGPRPILNEIEVISPTLKRAVHGAESDPPMWFQRGHKD